MVKFKFRPGIRKSYDEQGEIFFRCRRYASQGKTVRRRVDEMIHRAGGEYANALREYLLTNAGWVEVCQKWYISDRTLQRIVRRFFELW